MHDRYTTAPNHRDRRSLALGLAAALAAASAGCVAADTETTEPGEDLSTSALSATQIQVTLQTYAGNYLVADKGGGAALQAYSLWAKGWETFTLTDLNGGALTSGDLVTLKAQAGQWASATNGGGSDITFTATWEKAWEQFRIVKLGGTGAIGSGDKVTLQTSTTGQFVSAINAGGGAVTATATEAKEWETLKLQIAGAGVTSPRQKVLDFFASIQGRKTLAGIDNKTSPADDTNQLKGITGKKPSFWGNDFGFGSAVDARQKMIDEAKRQWNSGSVVQLQYHACIPTRDEYCSWDDIGGAHPQHLSDPQWNDLVTAGTALNKAWLGRLDKLAGFLQDLKNAGVAPLFRPLHEMNQGVFWWAGRGGANGTRKLWQITHDYLVNTKGLDNLVWVWNVQDFTSLSSDAVAYNPGPAYFDIAALDVYNTGYTQGNYNAMLSAAGGKPIAIGECQFIPTVSLLASQPQWTYFMLWPDFTGETRNKAEYSNVFNAASVLTEDEMPGWK